MESVWKRKCSKKTAMLAAYSATTQLYAMKMELLTKMNACELFKLYFTCLLQ